MAYTYVYGSYTVVPGAKVRNFIAYEITVNNNTTYTLSVYSGISFLATDTAISVSQSLSGTGQTSASGTATNIRAQVLSNKTIISARSWSWSKSTAPSTKTITVSGFVGGTRPIPSFSQTITVPVKSYTITYNANGGSGGGTQTKNHGTNVALWAGSKFSRQGYQPLKLNTKADGTGTSYNFGAIYTANADTTLYVIWQKDYTVSYNANGGTNAPSYQAKPYNVNIVLSNVTPTRMNYKFKGWASSQQNADNGVVSYNPGGSYSDNASITLYAVWQFDAVIRTVYKLDINKNYIETQEYVTLTTKTVPGNSVLNKFTFIGWFLERPSTIIYPVGTTAVSIGALTEINATMSNAFYAVYVDASPSTLHKIYDSSVVPNVTENIENAFQLYITAISNNGFYDNAAPYGADDVHTLFGYIQCNEDVHLSNTSGTCSNCAIPKTIEESVTDIYVGTTSKSETLDYTALEGTPIEVFFYKDTSSSSEPPDVLTFIGGQSEVKTYTNPATQITLTVTYNAENNTIAYVLNANPPGWWLLYLIKYTTEEVYDIGSSDLDSIQQVSNYIFYRITNNNITTSSKHTITITGIDSQNKAVSFTVENKIKLPLIDIHEWGDDLQGRKVIDINSDVSVLRMIGKSSSSHSDIYVAAPDRMGCLAVTQNIFGLYDNTNTNWLIKRAAGNSYVSIPSDLRLNNHTGQIGEVIDVRNTAAKTASSGTWYTCCSIKLDPGIWVISAFANWSNATQTGGTYAMGISESSTGGPWHNSIQAPTSTGINAQLHLTHLVDPDTTTTYYLRMRHSTGSSSNPGTCTIPVGNTNYSNCMRAIRIQ